MPMMRTRRSSKRRAKSWKGIATLIAYVLAIPLALLWPWLSVAIYVGVALIWLVPDKRFERLIGD